MIASIIYSREGSVQPSATRQPITCAVIASAARQSSPEKQNWPHPVLGVRRRLFSLLSEPSSEPSRLQGHRRCATNTAIDRDRVSGSSFARNLFARCQPLRFFD